MSEFTAERIAKALERIATALEAKDSPRKLRDIRPQAGEGWQSYEGPYGSGSQDR